MAWLPASDCGGGVVLLGEADVAVALLRCCTTEAVPLTATEALVDVGVVTTLCGGLLSDGELDEVAAVVPCVVAC